MENKLLNRIYTIKDKPCRYSAAPWRIIMKDPENIEYIRTEYVVERVMDYLVSQLCDNEYLGVISYEHVDMEELLEGLRTYIEHEE